MRHAQLRAFHSVAIHNGFTKAANALGLTQPAISDQIRKLEVEYDVRLFNRQKKQILLTSDGIKLLDITHRIFEAEQLAHDLLSESRAVQTGTLKIIADSARHMLHILGEFRIKYPQIQVSVRVGNSSQIVDELRNYQADIGVLGEIPQSRDYDVINLGSTPIIAFAARSLQDQIAPSMTMRQLSQCPLVLRETGSKTRAKFEAEAKAMGLKITAQIEAEGREAVREIVASGGGIGIVSQAEFTEDSRLLKIEISDANIEMDEALLCLHERRDSKLIRAFMQLSENIVNTR